MWRTLQCAEFLRDDYATNRTWQHAELPIVCQSKGKNSKSVVSPIAAHAHRGIALDCCRQRSKPAAKPWSVFAVTWAADRAAHAAEIVAVEKAGVADPWRGLRLRRMGLGF